jgi:DNA-binding NtrC family response regulator
MTQGASHSTSPPRSLLLVDDEQILRESLAELLSERYEVVATADGQEAYAKALERPFDLVLTDLRMPGMDGMALLERMKALAPQTPVVVMTAFGTVDNAVAAMRAGAADYVLKPVQFEDVLMRLEKALAYGDLARTREVLTQQAAAQSTFHNLVGHAPAMTGLFDTRAQAFDGQEQRADHRASRERARSCSPGRFTTTASPERSRSWR